MTMVSRAEYITPVEPKAETIQNRQKLTTITLLLTPAQEKKEQKIEDLATYYFIDDLNFTQACAKVGICRETGYEYMKLWKQKTEPLKVDKKFWQLLAIVEVDNPEKALDAVTKVKLKQTDENVNVKSEVTEHLEANVNLSSITGSLRDYEELIKRANPTKETINIQPDNITEQVH